MNRTFSFLFIFSFCFFIACNNDGPHVEEIDSNDIDAGSIWFDYQVWGEEGNDSLTIKLQFRFDNENGETITLSEPAKVEFDGRVLQAAYSKMTGEYYELRQALSTFTGKHTIRFTSNSGTQYKEEFTFRPLSLETEIPDTLQRGKIIFQWDGLDKVDHVRVLMTDTSYTSEGINRVDTVKNGQIIISDTDMSGLANGPIHLELIREDIRDVENGTFAGGRISISYGLSREFILKD